LPRKTITDELQPLLAGFPDKKVTFVLGGEGSGKSWIIAQSWLALDPKPLMVIFSPDEFQEKAAQNDIEELLISKLIAQTRMAKASGTGSGPLGGTKTGTGWN
jgi:hypothetical protein